MGLELYLKLLEMLGYLYEKHVLMTEHLTLYNN